jgi:HJR/Mrr/RecB family endonuclease
VAKVIPCFWSEQVQASGFVGNLHSPASNRIFHKKLAHLNTLPFYATKTTTTDPMGRRIILKNNTMEKKNVNNDFKNVSNEKQNSLAS